MSNVAPLTIASVLICLMACNASAQAESNVPQQLHNVGFDQRLNEQVPLDLEFSDEAGKHGAARRVFPRQTGDSGSGLLPLPDAVHFGTQWAGTRHARHGFHRGRRIRSGDGQFRSARDAGIGRGKKANYVARYGRPGGREGWHFLTGEERRSSNSPQAVGFRYEYDAKPTNLPTPAAS